MTRVAMVVVLMVMVGCTAEIGDSGEEVGQVEQAQSTYERCRDASRSWPTMRCMYRNAARSMCVSDCAQSTPNGCFSAPVLVERRPTQCADGAVEWTCRCEYHVDCKLEGQSCDGADLTRANCCSGLCYHGECVVGINVENSGCDGTGSFWGENT